MCGGSGGKSGGGGGGGSSETIATIETPFGTRYQIRDAQGNVLDLTKIGYSDRFSTPEKAQKALADHKAKQATRKAEEAAFLERANKPRAPVTAQAIPRTIAPSVSTKTTASDKATPKQISYARSLARQLGDYKAREQLASAEINGTKAGVSRIIDRLKNKKMAWDKDLKKSPDWYD